MDEMTLREICNTVGVSRRAVQGYENAGLISAAGKNGRGHLLYDKNAQERIKQIKLFQEMGFSIREIKEIVDAPGHVLKTALGKRVEQLKEERRNKETMIAAARELMERL